ncbi:MAG: hypothetical protein J1E98_11605 [Lachnospiraceae bacterium]|nr:hypothetical protein [Lachnospiraceae bacterium]
MKNLEKLLEYNSGKSVKIKIKDKKAIFINNSNEFSGDTVLKIINFVNSLHKTYKNVKIPIEFRFNNIYIKDKLSYVFFECICYLLMKHYQHMVFIYWKPQKNILTDGIFSSPLKLLDGTNHKSALKYPDKFESDLYRNHFRKIISGDKKDTNYLGELFQALDSFLKYFSIVKEYRDQIAEVIAELVGNACEHAYTDCLLDIDITNDHLKKIESVVQDGVYYGINITVVNFSDTLLGTNVKKKLYENNLTSERYLSLGKAYQYHKSQFSEQYTEDDFFNISAFQDKISGRSRYSESGGTGLTKLIRSLQEKSDVDSCYVVSGNRSVIFYKEKLEYNEQNWLGFNEKKDFLNAIPDSDINLPCHAYVPGTAYNLNFVMKREDE